MNDKPAVSSSVEARVLVTGGSGFIGTNLVQNLLDDGIAVLNMDIAPPRNPAHLTCFKSQDLLDRVGLQQLISAFQPSCVYHLGARTDLHGSSMGDYPANTDGVSHLIAICRDTPSIQRVIFASSRLVCKIGYQPQSDSDYCPTTAYGYSKVEGERRVRSEAGDHFTWTLVRPTSIWGPWFDIPYRTFFDTVRRGRYVHPGQLRILKSFGYVGNSVFQLRRLMQADADRIHGQTFYIGDYDPIEVKTFAQTIAAAFDGRPIRSAPVTLLKLAAMAGDTLHKLGYQEPPLTRFRLNNLCTNMLHEFDELKTITGPLPYSMANGVKQTVAWMKSGIGNS